MSHQGPWHLVDKTVISPLHGNSEVTPDDSISQVDSGHSKASSSSSRRRKEAKVKAAIASLQARQLAERVRRDNEICEQEFQEEMAQRELEWKLECRKRELDLLRKKREDEIAIISAQNQAEVAQLEHQILDQPIEGKLYETGKVSTSLPYLNGYLVPSPKEFADISSCTKVTPGISDGYIFQEHSRSAEDTPLYICTV